MRHQNTPYVSSHHYAPLTCSHCCCSRPTPPCLFVGVLPYFEVTGHPVPVSSLGFKCPDCFIWNCRYIVYPSKMKGPFRDNCLMYFYRWLAFPMTECVEGIRRALLLGLVLIAGIAIQQAHSVGPQLFLLIRPIKLVPRIHPIGFFPITVPLNSSYCSFPHLFRNFLPCFLEAVNRTVNKCSTYLQHTIVIMHTSTDIGYGCPLLDTSHAVLAVRPTYNLRNHQATHLGWYTSGFTFKKYNRIHAIITSIQCDGNI